MSVYYFYQVSFPSLGYNTGKDKQHVIHVSIAGIFHCMLGLVLGVRARVRARIGARVVLPQGLLDTKLLV